MFSRFQYRVFSTSLRRAERALIYSEKGEPRDVISSFSYSPLSSPPPGTVNLKFLLAPVNPADINVVQGVYPAKPVPPTDVTTSSAYIGGNEGLARVTSVGEGVPNLMVDDWVIMSRPQLGTWATARNVKYQDITKLPPGLTAAQGATITVNPPTAYNLLHEFVRLERGDWVIQNGANSAVGQAVIQIATAYGIKTINLIRNRDDLGDVIHRLKLLGATEVFTYEDLLNKGFRERIKHITSGKDIRLGLNCVSGRETSLMARLLGNGAQLISYGAMSKEPLSLPTSLFIFQNLAARGFWQSNWYATRSHNQRAGLLGKLAELFREHKLDVPEHEVFKLDSKLSDTEATTQLRNLFDTLSRGRYGKKVLLEIQ